MPKTLLILLVRGVARINQEAIRAEIPHTHDSLVTAVGASISAPALQGVYPNWSTIDHVTVPTIRVLQCFEKAKMIVFLSIC